MPLAIPYRAPKPHFRIYLMGSSRILNVEADSSAGRAVEQFMRGGEIGNAGVYRDSEILLDFSRVSAITKTNL